MQGVNFGTLLIVFAIILVSMMLHELAHGFVAYLLGDDTAKTEGRLTLNPLKHLDPILSVIMPLLLFISGGPIFGGAKPVPVDSRNLRYGVWGMALVAIAGPLTNFLIAFVAFMVGMLTGVTVFDGGALMYYVGDFWGLLLVNIVYVNLGFGVFNLIPIPPLDGSRILYALAPDQVRQVMEGMERWGILLVMILVVVGTSLIGGIMQGAMSGILEGFDWVARLFGR